jgi:hypothetical protein
MDSSMSSPYASDPYSFQWEDMQLNANWGRGGDIPGTFLCDFFLDAGSFSVYWSVQYQLWMLIYARLFLKKQRKHGTRLQIGKTDFFHAASGLFLEIRLPLEVIKWSLLKNKFCNVQRV